MSEKVRAFIELSKPRILSMILVTTFVGYALGGHGVIDSSQLVLTLLGTALCCGGAGMLNNFIERDTDRLMERTKNRVLVRGIVAPTDALGAGVLCVLTGTTLLAQQVNLITGFLALLTAFLYALVYTPLKRITWLNTTVGAVPGALPILGGWSAAAEGLDAGAWILFAIMFLWQHPHFYSIAWMYREDYARGGFKMLPVVEPDGHSTFRQIIGFTVILLGVSLLPFWFEQAGIAYLVSALLLGSYMLFAGVRVFHTRTIQDARKLLRASIIYLPLLLVMIVLDSGIL